MKQVAPSTLHVYTEGTKRIGVRASRRYLDTAARLTELYKAHQYLNSDGLSSSAELQYVRHGGRPAVLEGLKQLQPIFGFSYEQRPNKGLAWSSARSIGFHFSIRNRSRLHDVEVQCVTSLEDCFDDELNKPHRNFEPVTEVQRVLETSDLIVTPCASTARELTDYFDVQPNQIFLIPAQPLTYRSIELPLRPVVAIVLVDGLSRDAKAEALRCAQFLRSQLPRFDSVLCWDLENGESRDQGLLDSFDVAGPLQQTQKVKLMSAAHATVLIGSSPTTDGIMSEARLSQRLAAPRLRGYEPTDPDQTVHRYEVTPGAGVAALKRLIVTPATRPSIKRTNDIQTQSDKQITALQTAIEELLKGSN